MFLLKTFNHNVYIKKGGKTKCNETYVYQKLNYNYNIYIKFKIITT